MTPRLVPVIDLWRGEVVHAVAGQRAHYRPLVDRWSGSSAPLQVARAYRALVGHAELYLADLGAIVDQQPDWSVISAMCAEGAELAADVGRYAYTDPNRLIDCGVQTIVAGLECCHHPAELAALVQQLGPERVQFSVDLRDGIPQLPSGHRWAADTAAVSIEAVLRAGRAAGVRRWLVLDLVSVGGERGLTTLSLCEQIAMAEITTTEMTTGRPKEPLTEAEITTGGGVSSLADLERAAAAGIHRVLVATALQTGTLQTGTLETGTLETGTLETARPGFDR